MDKDCRIGIIGAGCSGISAAIYLKDYGFNNITILEAEDHIGGKCLSFNYRDKIYELGCMMAVNTNKEIIDLVKRAGMSSDGPMLYRGFFKVNGTKTSQVSYGDRIQFKNEYMKLKDILKKYSKLKEPGFKHVPKELCKPFSVWCEENNIPMVGKVFAPPFTSFGYGYLNQISAAYVLKFLDYETLNNFINISHQLTWSKGSQSIWESLAAELDVRLSQRVIKIERSDKINVYTEINNFEFDKLIVTVPVDLNTIDYDCSDLEKKLFSMVKYNNYDVFAYEVENIPKCSGYIPENFVSSRDGHILVWYLRWQNTKSNDLVTVYVLSNNKTEKECRKIVEDDFKNFGIKHGALYIHKRWHHFPHVDGNALADDFYDKLESFQGNKNTYYIGELMNFACMNNCAIYSKHIAELIKKDNR